MNECCGQPSFCEKPCFHDCGPTTPGRAGSVAGVARKYQCGGDHYVTKAVQPWDAMQSWMTPEQFEGYLRGCAIKYVARYRDKGGVEDVKKAQHYLQRLVEHLEAGE